MIIRKLNLKNIRSYKEENILFPIGKSLFEGDIGSGKSTILMAIEFAFFGLGSEKGSSLLRTGESNGEVRLSFEVDEKEYSIHRFIERRATSVQQKSGELIIDKEKFTLSPSELKEKILRILGFNESVDPKAQSVIYRYAIFTPQEEMKSILYLRPELRLQTLRKAFRIEDYKIAIQNVEELLRIIRDRQKEFVISSSDLDEFERRLKKLSSELDIEESTISNLNNILNDKENFLKEFQRMKESLHKDELRIDGVRKEISFLQKVILNNENNLKNKECEIEELSGQIKEIEFKINELEKIRDVKSKTNDKLSEEINRLENKILDLRKSESQIEGKISEFKSIWKRKICPTCERPAKPEEFEDKIQEKRIDLKRIVRKINYNRRRLEEVSRIIENKKKFEDARVRIKEYQGYLRRHHIDRERRNSEIGDIYSSVKESEEKLRESLDFLKKLEESVARLQEIDFEITKYINEIKVLREEFVERRTIIKKLKKEKEENISIIKKKEVLQKRAQDLSEYLIWIKEYFVPTLDNIEKNVMMNINSEFNSNFQRWFGILVEDSGKDARIDEDFTPIVEQDGYDQNIYYLSGGERTSVALSYRLALNKIVQKVSTGMKSNLLILDEPTDGFSKEQLGKVREILDEVESQQIIIVSHEKELESFADQIFRVTKTQGISRIN